MPIYTLWEYKVTITAAVLPQGNNRGQYYIHSNGDLERHNKVLSMDNTIGNSIGNTIGNKQNRLTKLTFFGKINIW